MEPIEVIITIIIAIISFLSGFFIQKYFRKEQYRFEVFLERKRVYKDLLQILNKMNGVANRRIKETDLIKYRNELSGTIYSNIPFISPELFGLLSQYLIKFILLKQANIQESFQRERGIYETDAESSLSRIYFSITDEIIKELSVQTLLDTEEFNKIISQKDNLYNELLRSRKKSNFKN